MSPNLTELSARIGVPRANCSAKLGARGAHALLARTPPILSASKDVFAGPIAGGSRQGGGRAARPLPPMAHPDSIAEVVK